MFSPLWILLLLQHPFYLPSLYRRKRWLTNVRTKKNRAHSRRNVPKLSVFSKRPRLQKSSITKQKASHAVNVVCDGSPSLILRVRLISLGITILPKSSTRRTISVAVRDIFIVIARSAATWQSASLAAKGGAVLCTARKRIPTPVCALARNDSGSRQPPTIILQITLFVSVKGRR